MDNKIPGNLYKLKMDHANFWKSCDQVGDLREAKGTSWKVVVLVFLYYVSTEPCIMRWPQCYPEGAIVNNIGSPT